MPSLKPTCRNCQKKPAKKGSLFCTQKCGEEYANNLLGTRETVYCARKGIWGYEVWDKTCIECGESQEDAHHVSAYDWWTK